MDKPEVRTVYDDPNYMRNVDAKLFLQQAIPWCIAHDDMASWDALDERCWAYGRATVEGACVISHGGLDHKWWVDV